MGEFKQAEFIKGCTVLGCDDVKKWKDVLKNKLYPELKNDEKYLKLYKYAFNFATEKGFKNVEVETACALWELFLGKKCQFLGKWIQFIQEEKKELKVITQDCWDLFYDLVKQTDGDIKKFVDDGAWPSMVDEFVAYLGN